MNNKLTRYENDDFFSGNWLKNFFDLPSLSGSNILKTNIRKEGNNYVYEIDIPGYSKEDVKVSYENGYLIVEAKTKRSSNSDNVNSNYIRQERYTGTCSRSYYVGEVEESEISAKYFNGILSVNVPVEEKEKNNKIKTIDIE